MAAAVAAVAAAAVTSSCRCGSSPSRTGSWHGRCRRRGRPSPSACAVRPKATSCRACPPDPPELVRGGLIRPLGRSVDQEFESVRCPGRRRLPRHLTGQCHLVVECRPVDGGRHREVFIRPRGQAHSCERDRQNRDGDQQQRKGRVRLHSDTPRCKSIVWAPCYGISSAIFKHRPGDPFGAPAAGARTIKGVDRRPLLLENTLRMVEHEAEHEPERPLSPELVLVSPELRERALREERDEPPPARADDDTPPAAAPEPPAPSPRSTAPPRDEAAAGQVERRRTARAVAVLALIALLLFGAGIAVGKLAFPGSTDQSPVTSRSASPRPPVTTRPPAQSRRARRRRRRG